MKKEEKNHSQNRWPSHEEVKQHFLFDGHGVAYGLVTGFSDYRPAVCKFRRIWDTNKDCRVQVTFPDGFWIFTDSSPAPEGLKIDFLVLKDQV